MYKVRFAFILLLIGGTALSAPPPVPSAGVIERELEKEYEATPLSPEKQWPRIEIDIPEEKIDLPDGVFVKIEQVQFRGNQVFSAQTIEKWIKSFIGQELNLKGIYSLCQAIDREYAKRGYFLARAYPPKQTIVKGVLLIEVVEGRLGSVSVEGEQFYSESFIRSYFSKLCGKALNYDAFMRALLLLNETRDLQASAIFAKGKTIGTADVIVQVKDARPLHLYLNGNNYGKNITTNFRLGGRLDVGSVMTYGDQISIAEVVGFPVNALYFTDVRYKVPLSRNGDFLELDYLFSKFKVEEMLSLHLKGESNIGTLKISHAWSRSREMSVDVYGCFDIKQIQNYVLGSVTSYDKLRVATLGFLIDQFGASRGRNYLNIRLGAGIPDFLGGMSSVSSSCSTLGAGGRFFKVNADYDYLQMFLSDCVLSAHLSGQWSPYKLAIAEQIYIGGSDTVRGFPLSVALGNSGYYGNLEVLIPPPGLANLRFFMAQKKWREVFQLAAFFDTGGVFVKGGSDTFLSGSGVGFRYKGPWNFSLSFDVGFPLNHQDLSNGTMYYIKVTGQPF